MRLRFERSRYVCPDKIVVSNWLKITDTTSKLFIGYLDENVTQPLCIILPQMSGFIKHFGNDSKNMSFITDDNDVYSKYMLIWEKVRKASKLKFNVNPIRDKKYLLAKLKIYNGVNKTTSSNDEIPKEKNHYACIAVIDTDSVLKIDKKVYPQVYLEQCKYKLKKRRPANFINDKIEPSDDDSDDYVLNFVT